MESVFRLLALFEAELCSIPEPHSRNGNITALLTSAEVGPTSTAGPALAFFFFFSLGGIAFFLCV